MDLFNISKLGFDSVEQGNNPQNMIQNIINGKIKEEKNHLRQQQKYKIKIKSLPPFPKSKIS